MKMNWKTLSVVALAGLMMLGSCKKNEENNTTDGSFTLRAGIEKPTSGSRTSFDDGAINWSAGDQILVNAAGNVANFRLTSGAGSTTAVFNGPGGFEEQAWYAAVYPAAGASFEGTNVTFTVPQEQTLTAGNTFANGCNPMVAYTDETDGDLNFRSVFGGICIQLKGNGTKALVADKLVLTSRKADDYLCGTFTVDANGAAAATHVGTEGGNSITVNLPNVTLTAATDVFNAFVMLPQGTLSQGLDVAIYYNGLELKTNGAASDLSIVMNKIKGVVEYAYPAAPATAGAPATQEELNVVLSQIAAGSYTGNITLAATGSTPTTFNFGMEEDDAPITNKIVVAAGSNVKVENLYAKSTTSGAQLVEVQAGANVVLDHVNLETTNGTTSTPATTYDKPVNIVGNGAEVTIKDSQLKGKISALYISDNCENVTVNVERTSIEATSHYAIVLRNDTKNCTVNLKDCLEVKGYCALNLRGTNLKVYAENSTLYGINETSYTGPSYTNDDNDFGTISYSCWNCEVELNNCTLKAEARVKEGQSHSNTEWAALTQTRMEPSTVNTLKLNGGTLVKGITTGTDQYPSDHVAHGPFYNQAGRMITIVGTEGTDYTVEWDHTWN